MGKIEEKSKISGRPSFSRMEHLKYLSNVTFTIVLLLTLILMVNYISSRHYRRIDITQYQKHTLSPKTGKLLQQINIPIQITVISEGSNNSLLIYMKQLIHDLLEEYQNRSPELKISHWDYYRDNQKVENLAKVLETKGFKEANNLLRNSLVFQGNGLSKIIAFNKFFESGKTKRPDFKGEQLLSSTIHSILHKNTYRVVFLAGHGELNPDSDHPDGLSLLKNKFIQENATVSVQEISAIEPLIKNVDLLLIAAPRQLFLEGELQALDEYLNSGGKMLIFAEPSERSNLNRILRTRGIYLNAEEILERNRNAAPTPLVIRQWTPEHPINLPLGRFSGYSVYMESVGTLKVDSEEKEYRAQPIAQSEPQSYILPSSGQKKPLFGPFPVAAVSQSGNMRLVVFADSDFIKNGERTTEYVNRIGLRDGANADLALNAFNWCLEETSRLSIDTKPIDLRAIQLDSDSSRRIGFILCIVLPLLAIVFYWAIYGWLQLDSLRSFFDLMEALIQQPSHFFSTSLSAFSLPKVLKFQTGAALFFGIILYLLSIQFLISYQTHPSFQNATWLQKIALMESQSYQWSYQAFVTIPPEEELSTLPRPDLRTAFLIRIVQYFFLLLGLSFFITFLTLASTLIHGFFLCLILPLFLDSKVRKGESFWGKEAWKILSLSLFPIHWICPLLGFYSFYILGRGFQKGYSMSTAKSILLVLLLILFQVGLVSTYLMLF